MTDDDSPILKRRPLRRPPVIPPSPDSPSQAQPKLAVPSTPDSSSLQSASTCHAPPPPDTMSTSHPNLAALQSIGSALLESAVGCRWLEARRLRQLLKTPIATMPPFQPPLDGPPLPNSSALSTAVASDQPPLDGPPLPSSSALPTAVASEVVKEERLRARVSRRVSRRQRRLNDKRIAHQAVEVNAADESMEGSSNSEDDACVG
jgi:hypothetical protein